MISEVIEGGAAARSGLVPGDILLKPDDQLLAGVDDQHRLLTLDRADKQSNLSVMRGPHIQSVTIVPESDG
jgi:S1-C subfamily serine protease